MARFSAPKPLSQVQLQVTPRRIAELKLNPRNPRLHSDKQIRKLAKSISTFGLIVPVLIDSQGVVLAGHGRILAAESQGISEVPTICIRHLTPAQAIAFTIADNRLTEIADWDEKLLGEQLQLLVSEEFEFDIDATGFEIGEIDILIEGLSSATDDSGDSADDIPTSAVAVQVSKAADLWTLGRNKIYCGNALEASSFIKLLDGRQANLVFTDPPYNVKIAGFAGGHGAIQHRDFGMASGEMTAARFTDFLSQALALLATHSADGSMHYVFIDWRHISELVEAAKPIYAETKNVCVWTKDQPGLGSLYRSQHELIFVFKKGTAPHRNNVQLGSFGRNRTNVWPYPAINSFARSTAEQNPLELHPTAKPVALVADAIMDCSSRGDIVLDSFLGSGTTLIAAERTGRTCYGIEIDPSYVDTAIRRWESFTGLTAVHATSGRKFTEVERELTNEIR
jgi:DNA modification methylase